jgi:hypothetical protein
MPEEEKKIESVDSKSYEDGVVADENCACDCDGCDTCFGEEEPKANVKVSTTTRVYHVSKV